MEKSGKRKSQRRWSFADGPVSPAKIALQALLTVVAVVLLFLLLFRFRQPSENIQQERASGVFRLSLKDPELRHQLDLRDPSAALIPEAPAGYLALRPRREQEVFISRPKIAARIAPAPRIRPFIPLPEAGIPPSLSPVPSSGAALSPRPQREGRLFSEEGDFLASLPLPSAETEAKAGRTILKISGSGPLRQVVPLFSCGNFSRDRSAQAFLESRSDPDGLYLVLWPETRKEISAL